MAEQELLGGKARALLLVMDTVAVNLTVILCCEGGQRG